MALLVACVDYPEFNFEGNNPTETDTLSYMLKVNESVSGNDTIYLTVNTVALFVVIKEESGRQEKVTTKMFFGDGGEDLGKEVLYVYRNAGIYNFVAEIDGKAVSQKIVKVSSPIIKTAESLVQLSGNTVGDSAVIKLLCRKDNIFGYERKGQYFMRGDMTDWKTSIKATDTSYVVNGTDYLLFQFKVKNGKTVKFGYYKVGVGYEDWSYNPSSIFWDKEKNLYSIYVEGGNIYPNETKTYVPGGCGDEGSAPCIRLDFLPGSGGKDSILIYANRLYLGSDSLKMGISVSIDGAPEYQPPIKYFGKWYIMTRVPAGQKIDFVTYKDLGGKTKGEMSSSVFYRGDRMELLIAKIGIGPSKIAIIN